MTDYYSKPNGRSYGNNNRSTDYPYIVTNRSKHGLYNVTERDYGDKKVSNYIPAEYENNYDPSYLDSTPIYDEYERYNTPILIRRRYYRQIDENNPYYDDDELPVIPSRRYIYPPSSPPQQPRVIKRVYFRPSPSSPPPPPSPPPPQIVEYVYKNNHKPNNEEYIVPKPKYIKESQSVHRPAHRENLSPLPVPPRHQPSPLLLPRQPIKPPHLNESSTSRHSQPNQPIPRTTINNRESSNKSFPQINNKPKQYLTLKEVLAQNRARRGSRIPIPRREVYEEQVYDLPTYRKNYVKNGFIIHK